MFWKYSDHVSAAKGEDGQQDVNRGQKEQQSVNRGKPYSRPSLPLLPTSTRPIIINQQSSLNETEKSIGLNTVSKESEIKSRPSSNIVLAKKLYHLNDSKSKNLIIGMHRSLCFQPIIEIKGSKGQCVDFHTVGWKDFIKEIEVLSTYVFNLDQEEVAKLENKYLPNHVVFVKMYKNRVVLGVRSIFDDSQGVFLSEVTTKNIIKYSQLVTSIIQDHEVCYRQLYNLYCEIVVDINSKYSRYIFEFEGEEDNPLSCVQFVRNYVRNLNCENTCVSKDFKYILMELGADNIVNDLE
jgi:hypothetical protein